MTFVDDYLAGQVEAWQIHDHIAAWHDNPDSGPDLAEYLGMTWEQYKAWGERGVLPERVSDEG